MNLGQSEFQDTYFVSQAALTPYRRLRQIELELRSIEDSLVRASINLRRAAIKLQKLDTTDPEQALDAEEIAWEQLQMEQLYKDAQARKANFLRLKDELLASVPQEYWDRGFEAAEPEHWVAHFSKQLALENLTTGRPSKQTIEQVMLLPRPMQVLISQRGKEEFVLLNAPEDNSSQVSPA